MTNSALKWRQHFLSLLALAFVTLLVFAEPLRTGTMPLHTDGQFMTFPAIAYFKRWALRGFFPVWWITDSVTGNMADTGSLGPAWLLLTPFFLAFKLETVWFLHSIFLFLMAGVCMYFYLARMTQHWLASLYGALLFMRSEWVTDCLVEPQIQLFLFPLILCCKEEAAVSGRLRYFLLAAFLSALFFLGSHAHFSFYLMPFAWFYLGVRIFQTSASSRWPRLLAYSLSQIFFFLSLVWFRVYVLANLASQITRKSFAETVPNLLAPFNLATAVFPNLFTSSSVKFPYIYNRILQGNAQTLVHHGMNFLEFWYPGLFVIFFLCISWSALKKMPWLSSHWLAFFCSLAYVMGGEVLLFSLLQKIKLLNLITNTQRISVVTTVTLPILAATGFSAFLEKDSSKELKRWGFFFALLALLFLIKDSAVLVTERYGKAALQAKILDFLSKQPIYDRPPSFYSDRIDEFFLWFKSWANWRSPALFVPFGLYGLGSILYGLWNQKKIPPALTAFSFLALVVWDGFIAHPLPLIELASRKNAYPETPSIQFLLQDHSLFRFLSLKPKEETRFPWGHRQFLPADKQLVYGLASVHGYQGLTLKRYGDIFQVLGKETSVDPIRLHDLYQYDEKMADLLNVKYIVVEKPMALPHEKLVFEDDSYRIYENPNVFPRAFLVPESRPVSNSSESLELLQEGKLDFRKTVILEKGSAPAIQAPSLTQEDQASVLLYSPHKIQLKVAARAERILVLTDAYHPAWKSFLDGRRVPLYIADHAFRGVLIPAGSHQVEFRLELFSYQRYYAGMGLALAFALSVFLFYRKK